MIKKIVCISLFIFSLITMFSCQKENIPSGSVNISLQNPQITTDTSLEIGQVINFNVIATSENSNITFLGVRLNHATVLDSGLNYSSLNYKFSTVKSGLLNERWTFIVMNKSRERDSIVVNIAKKNTSNFNPINTYSNVILGAQNNCCFNGFFSTSNGNVFDYATAFNNMNKIDIIYCYYQDVQSTLSSPNEADISSIYSGIANWLVKNESRYNITTLTPADFDAAQHDSLIIASYEVVNAKRKAKYVQNNQVWAFKVQNSKMGLIKINNVVSDITGKIDVSIKIQQ